jgi:CheY-like chemotaxis protein
MPKVLYIEDNPDIANLVCRWLEEEELTVLHALDGLHGLNLVMTERPDLILLDIMLGEFSIDGWEVNRRLKADPQTAAIPVIALTSYGQPAENRAHALQEGFVEHVSLPFNYDQLVEQVWTHLRGPRA